MNNYYEVDMMRSVENSWWDKTKGAAQLAFGSYLSVNTLGMAGSDTMAEGMKNISDSSYKKVKEIMNRKSSVFISQDVVDKVNAGIDSKNLTSKKYKFDKSGFTW